MNPTVFAALFGAALAALVTGLFMVGGTVVNRILTAPDRLQAQQKDDRLRTDEVAARTEATRVAELHRTDDQDKALRHEYGVIIERLQAEIKIGAEEKSALVASHSAEKAVLEAGIVHRTEDIEHWRGLHDKQTVAMQYKEFLIFLLRRDRKEVLLACTQAHNDLHQEPPAVLDAKQVMDMVVAKLSMEIDLPETLQ